MRTIWKTTLKVADVQEIEVPEGALMLTAREQFEDICVWFLCNPNAAKTKRKIAIVGTGHPAPGEHDAHYLGTASLQGGALMFHVFEKP